MRKWLFGAILIALTLAVFESAAYFLFGHLEEKYLTYSSAVRFHKRVPIFEQITKGGVEYYRAKFFPERYYSDLVDSRGKEILKNKTSDVFRIFVYGESSVAGSPFGHWGSFALNLHEQLDRIKKRPGTVVEVMNFGLSSIGSTRIAHFVEQTIEYQPDLIIVYMGHNEIFDNSERILREKQIAKSEVGELISDLARNSYLFKLAGIAALRLAVHKRKVDFAQDNSVLETNMFDAFSGMSFPQRQDMYKKIFEENVGRIVQLAKDRGIRLLLLSQISNDVIPPAMTNWVPPTHYLDATPSITRPPSASEAAEARLRKAFENNESTATALSEVLKLNGTSAYAAYVQGVEALKSNMPAKALSFFLLAKEWDPYPIRFRSTYKKVLEAQHRPSEGVYFVDAEEFVRSQLQDRILDGRVIIDDVHPNLTGYKMLASSIIQLHLARSGVYGEFFDFSRYVPADIWRVNVDPSRYWLVCQRYFKKFKSGGWNNCIDLAKSAYGAARTIDERRAHLRLWEFLFYFALSHKDKAPMIEALRLYPEQPNTPPREMGFTF